MNRRETVAAIAAGILTELLAPGGRAAAAAEDMPAMLAELPRIDDPENPSFDVFYRLSQWVTCRPDLSREDSRILYPVFMKEPWGTKHISTAFAEIRDALTGRTPPPALPEIITSGALGEGEAWFVKHLLTTWYLGIYYHETGDRRLLYEGALMFEAIADTHPIPGFSDREYGFWAEKPEPRPE